VITTSRCLEPLVPSALPNSLSRFLIRVRNPGTPPGLQGEGKWGVLCGRKWIAPRTSLLSAPGPPNPPSDLQDSSCRKCNNDNGQEYQGYNVNKLHDAGSPEESTKAFGPVEKGYSVVRW